MKILVLTKRQYTGHDLVDDKFGRLREIPMALARRGHDVRGLCLSYADRPEGDVVDDDGEDARVPWTSINAGNLKVPGLLRYLRTARRTIDAFEPDIVWACSDSLYGIIGTRLCRARPARCVFDVYDNFEFFGTVSIPGVRRLYRQAVREASGVTTVSDTLIALLESACERSGPTLLLENAVRKDIFQPLDKAACRRELGIPEDAKVIGVAGALSQSRGIEAVFAGFEKVAGDVPDTHLVIAGARDGSIRLPTGARIHDLGVLPLARVPVVLNALDVAVIANRDSAFGRYCFPQKLNEIVACGVPFVAADVGAMQAVLADHPAALFRPDDADDFARAAAEQLREPFRLDRPTPTWDDQAAHIDDFFAALLRD